MANVSEGFKNVFLAGIGAMAITGEKAKEMVDVMIAKGEITVEQGKDINSELKRKAANGAAQARDAALEARMSFMNEEERAAFVAKAAEVAEKLNAKDAQAQANEVVEVEVEASEDKAEGAE